jgi:hypothetical protein
MKKDNSVSITLRKNKFFPLHFPFAKRKSSHKYLIAAGVVAALFSFRIILIQVAFNKINNYLASFSPTYAFHITDLDISIIRGSYRFEGIEGKLKRNGRKFAEIKSVEVSMAWRELIHGRILTDIEVREMNFTYLHELTAVAKKKDKDDAKDAKEILFPVRVQSLDLTDSTLVLEEYPGLDEGKRLSATDIEGRITNLIGTEKFPLSYYNFKAQLLGTSRLIATGQLNLEKTPKEWIFQGQIEKFKLTEANSFLKRNVPLTFTKGTLDVYAEAISQKGNVDGYVKPFFRDIDVVSSQEHFPTIKRTFVEYITALANLVLRASDTKTVATKIPFTDHGGKFSIGKGEAIEKVLENGFQQQLTPGLENKYELK